MVYRKSRDILKHRGYVVYGAAQGPLSTERVYMVYRAGQGMLEQRGLQSIGQMCTCGK